MKTQQHFPNWLPCKERFISATTTCHLTQQQQQQQQLNILSSFWSSVLVQIQRRRREEEEEEEDDDADEKERLTRNGCKMEVVRFRQFGGSFVIHITNLSFLVQEIVREFNWRKGELISFFLLIYSVFFFFSCLTGSNDLLKYHGWGFRRGVEPFYIYISFYFDALK